MTAPLNLERRLHAEMLRLDHPGWTDEDVANYTAWVDANKPRLRDHFLRLWRTLVQQGGRGNELPPR